MRLRLVLLAATLAMPVNAYYYFMHYLPGGNAPEKFDLTALPYNTVNFLVSESGPTTYTATDTFNSVLAQIQQAAQIWNGVSTSSLRVAFGGLENAATQQNTAGGDVVFEDLPPGVEGFGGPTSLANPVTAADGKTQFFPIVRSVIHLSLNLTVAPGPSYGQAFLMTTLHEMGHSLGLQHTFTSATMSQNTTRATTLTHPLSSDDVAGISALYPNTNFNQLGSISGQITAGGIGVHLASVVAIAPGSDALSAVTNPDGTYQINGVPPGPSYAVYVHTMPPDADIFGPYDGSNNVVAASGPVNSFFYPQTTDFTQATLVTVKAGVVTANIDIATTTRSNVPYYDGQVYGYPSSVGLTPGPVLISANPTAAVASIVGLAASEPLSVQFPDVTISLAPNRYTPTGILPVVSNGYSYFDLYLGFGKGVAPGLEHMIFNTPDYMYVLPSAMYLTLTGPPTVTNVTPNGDGTLTLTGTNLSATSLIYFDSLSATILSLDPVKGVAVVTPPAGANAQQATVTVYNTDGQNSQMLQASSPVTFPYGNEASPAIATIWPSVLPAGSEAMIDITGTGFSFVQGQTTVGFGTSDILVQRIFVLSPTHIQVDVSVSAKAALSTSDVTVTSAFQVASLPASFQTVAPVAGLPEPYPDLVNAFAASGITGAYPGAIVSLYGTNMGSTASITIGGVIATVLYSSPTQINLIVPSGLLPGPAILTLSNGQATAFPITVNIDPPPAGFGAVQSGTTGAYIDSTQPAYQGEPLIATMVNFAPAGSNIALSQVQVSLGGVIHPALKVAAYGAIWQVTFQIGPNDPTGAAETLIVYLNGLSSLPATIQVAAAPSH